MDNDSTENMREILIEVIGELPEVELQIIEMRYFEKRSYREIGEILDMTENNAKVKAHRVVKKMKKIYQKS